MTRFVIRALLCISFLLSPALLADPLVDAINSDIRPDKQSARDSSRHPLETLQFFGIQPSMSVVEISPGGGWYTNILAPYLKDAGHFYAAHFYVDENSNPYYKKSRDAFEKKVSEFAPYNKIHVTSFHPTKSFDIAPAGSADMVLTFRNIHNRYMREGDKGIDNSFSAFFTALKKGGVLGVVEHRLPEEAADEMQKSSGYMKQSYVVAAALKAGFILQSASEINANPKDTANHPKGVWTLPPRLRLGDEDKAKYVAIGESDRMTLKFVKP